MIELRMPGSLEGQRVIQQVGLIALRFPGEHVLSIAVVASDPRAPAEDALDGPVARTLTLGPDWRFDGSPACMAALNEFGEAVLVDDDR